MKRFLTSRAVGLFCLKFLVLAPLFLFLWGMLLPYYAQILGQMSGMVLKHVLRDPVQSMGVHVAGIWNTETLLTFTVGGREMPLQVATLTINVASYLALVLSTAELALSRRLKILALGSAVLVGGQVVYILATFHFAASIAGAPEIPTSLAQFFIMLPVLLWIILAYWDHLRGFFSDAAPTKQKDGANR